MANATINVVASLAGQTVPVSVSRQDDGTSLWTPTVAAAQAATGWTQTDASDGVAAMPDGHGIQTGDKIDVFWTGGRRYGMAATVAGDNVTLAGGGGDNLPANGTSVMLCEETAVNASFNPADLTAILVNVTNRTSVVFVDASGAVLLAIELDDGGCCLWWTDSGITPPLTGNPVAQILLGNAEASADPVTIGVLYNATPGN